jgi:hypothetical protein
MWSHFEKESVTFVTSIGELDPFISRLVKALWSIGVTTCSCCDGHGKNEGHIEFAGKINVCWFELILDNFISSRIDLECEWRRSSPSSDMFKMSHSEGNVLAMYRELQKVACLIEGNEDHLTDLKEKAVESVNRRLAKEIPVHLKNVSENLWS